MNIARPFCALALFTSLLTALVGCQGIQGVRYHGADLEKIVSEVGASHGDAGFAIGMASGEAGTADDGSVPSPHPRFHPVPTRPVFEPSGVVAVSAVEELPTSQNDANESDEPQSVLRTPRDTSVMVASNDVTVLPSEPLGDSKKTAGEEDESAPEETGKPESTSRRKAEEAEKQPESATATSPSVNDEPPAFTPVEVEAPSTNDMWRPRVAAP